MRKRILIRRIEKYIKQNFYGNLHHGWAHMNRVRNYAVYIAKKEGADTFVAEISALLHDIAKIKYGPTAKEHAKRSAKMAGKILEKMKLDKKTIEEVCNAIKSHSRLEPPLPKTLNQKVLYDADGLELVGAVGILRTALSSAYSDKNWDDLCKKIQGRFKFKNTFYTETAKKMAEKRTKLLESFFSVLSIELNQKNL